MKIKRFPWHGAYGTFKEIRIWAFESWPQVNVDDIKQRFTEADDRDGLLLELTNRFDATETPLTTLAVDRAERSRALAGIDSGLRQSLEFAAANVRAVAQAQIDEEPQRVTLSQDHSVTMREVPLAAAGVYAPGGRAAYPSSVLMCVIPAKVAGVERIALATPPGSQGKVNPVVLAAAELCGVDEVYAIGGAQAIFALVYGTETIDPVQAMVGPGNAWVREAKAEVAPFVAIDSLAGPSELMIIADSTADARWASLDLCAQAEHGEETLLVVVATSIDLLNKMAIEVERAAASRSGVGEAPLALLQVPDIDAAIDFANEFAPEHLQLLTSNAVQLVNDIRTAGAVFVGNYSATAFGDYVAGSNHVLPTGVAGRFSGPLGPHVFRRKIATVEVTAEAAAKLAPHVDRIARAEGFPVHGESAMIRTEK